MAAITFEASQTTSDTLVFVESFGFAGRIRPLGSSFQVRDADGNVLALKRTMQQAQAEFKYGYRYVR